jgi:hypothetical protein
MFDVTFKKYREMLEKEGIAELTVENVPKRKDMGERWLEIIHSQLMEWRKDKEEMISAGLLAEALRSSNWTIKIYEEPILMTLVAEVNLISKILGDRSYNDGDMRKQRVNE